MAGKYKSGDTVYIISAGDRIEKAEVLKYAGGFYTIRFLSGGGTKLRENRLFPDQETALETIKKQAAALSVMQQPVTQLKKTETNKPAPREQIKTDTFTPSQIIIHVDMDAFYASVEARDDPSLRGKPLIIGSLPNERGVVATCSYEARKYGVHSAMNIKEAYRLCPNGIYMHGDHEKYRRVSEQLHQIWNTYAAKSEYLALDEAYLDVTATANTFDRACQFARIIKERTWKELQLTCSIGIAYSKTAAKTASEEKKPNGYFAIPTPEDFVKLVSDRDVSVLYTVGKKTAEKLHSEGILTVRDLRDNEEKVIRLLGKQGVWLSRLARGIDESEVTPYKPEDAKSISREFTFQEDVDDLEFVKDVLRLLSVSVERRAKRHGLYGRGVTLKITYADMKSITRSKVIETSRSASLIYKEAVALLEKVPHKTLRLAGIGIHNLSDTQGDRQLSLTDTVSTEQKEDDLGEFLKPLDERYGLDFSGSIEKIFAGETLYKTVEYMRKYKKKQSRQRNNEHRYF
ncbi:MAG: DNA polymerase IV [Erysipelotrichaceae bacterium]|nr:DNA polymerase IV [Erysipelotrichaceae bacterium]